MKITSIDLEDRNPTRVRAELTIEELAFIAKFTGGMNFEKAEAVINDGYTASNALYEATIGDVFNRFWDNGLQGYLDGDDE